MNSADIGQLKAELPGLRIQVVQGERGVIINALGAGNVMLGTRPHKSFRSARNEILELYSNAILAGRLPAKSETAKASA